MIEKSRLTEISDAMLTEIRIAIRKGDLDALKHLVESDSKILQLDSVFGSVLHIAVNNEKLHIVRWLLEYGADSNMKSDEEELSCLNCAIGGKNIELVRLLLDHGASLDTTDTISNPLYGAIYHGHFEIAKLLIERGLDVNVQYKAKPPHTNALLFAKTWGRTDIVKLIEWKLSQSVEKDLSIMDDQTRKSVLKCIENDDLEALIKLIESDQKILTSDSVYGSVLHMVISYGSDNMVRWLLDQGADPNMKSKHEELSCLRCAIGKKNIELVRLLLDHGAALDTTDTLSNPLYGAIYYGNIEIAKLLIDRGLDVNVQYKAKPPHTNALLFAKTWGRTDIVKLIESKLPPASTDAGNIANEASKGVARPKSKTVKVQKSHDWSLHYAYDGDKPARFREFRISGNTLWTTQGNVMTWGETQRADFESHAEVVRAYEQACKQASAEGFEIDRSGVADKVATDLKALTNEIYRGAKQAFEATRRNHPDASPAMFGLQSDDDATLIVSVSNPHIDIDSVEKDEMERLWILNLWEYDEGSEYLDPAYRVLLLPHHGDPLPGGGLPREKVFDCFINALAALRKEGFFGSQEEEPIVLFQVLDSLEHVEQNKKLNSPEIFRKYRSWVTGK